MARYRYTHDCDLRLFDFFSGTSIQEPVYAVGDVDNISSITSASIIVDKLCDDDNTGTTTAITVCQEPTATFEVVSCVTNAADSNHRDISYSFAHSTTDTVTDVSYSYDFIIDGEVTTSTTLTAATGVLKIEDDASDQTVRVNYSFTSCNSVYNFIFEFDVPAGSPATCPTVQVNPMTLASQTPISSATYYREGDDLVIVTSTLGNHTLAKVDIVLTYTDGIIPNQELTIPYCVYIDCDETFKCRVVNYVWEKKDFEAMAMYEALLNVVNCQDFTCTNACTILDVLTEKLNECSC